jgi:hypothetical protein
MELLLNLIWLALALSTVAFYLRRRHRSAEKQFRCYQPLLALACVLFLLFPVISASDDLHPAQAVVEDASKRVQLAIAPLYLQQASAPASMLPAVLVLCLMSALAVLQGLPPVAMTPRLLEGAIVALPGRAPPLPSA